ncbi:MAG: hypothetical protein LC808_23815 [Actinobacteria bacterium]|nr:hypothetical protein [Actinomycetota bacterium]
MPSPAECAAWFTKQFERGAVVLADRDADVPLERVDSRDVDPATTLRWISRPRHAGARLLALEDSGAAALLLHVGADQLTGDVTLVALGDDDPAPVEQLRPLGVLATPTNDGALAGQDALASVLWFAVVAENEAPGRPDPDRPSMAPEEELPSDLADSRFIALADDFGAPLEAIWHVMWELAGVRWCLLNSDLDVDNVERIPYRQALPAVDFLRALRKCTDAGLSRLELPVYVTTGHGRGHTIHLQRFDGDDVIYHDPWPGRSLLAEGNNRMNVRARPERDERLWRITTEELARIGYASLVEPAVWLPICGVRAELSVADITASDLTGFFHFHETGRAHDEDEDVTRIAMAPGNWREQISLVVTVDSRENVSATQLLVDRTWIDDRATAPFAADLLKSYVHAAVTEADADDVELLVRGLAELSTGQLVEVLKAGPPHLLDQYRLLALTAVGSAPFARATLLCSTIRAYYVTDDEDREWLAVAVSRACREPGTLVEDHETGYMMDEYREYLWCHTQRELERLGWTPRASSPTPD